MKIKYGFLFSLTALLFFLSFSSAANAQKNIGVKTKTFGIVNTDLTIATSDTPDPVMRGENVTYTITVTNLTTAQAQNFTLRAFTSTNSTFVSFTAPNGFTCTTPMVGEGGQVNCSAPTVAGSSTNIFTMVANVPANVGIGASLYMPVDITASNDTNGGNNSAAETTDLAGGVFVNDAGGNFQTTNINTPFSNNLRVRVTDGNEVPLSGVNVTFTAPSSDASGTFTGGTTTAVVTTDVDGYATAPTFTANGSVGNYIVTATVPDANSSVEFNLTNVAPMTFTVTNTNDDGAGSLYQAIQDANDNSGDDTVVFDPAVFSTPQTIVLTGGEIFVAGNGSLTINGPGADKLTISGNNSSRIFSVSGDLILNDLKIVNGSNAEDGGAISTFGNRLQINRCAFYNNTADQGGAISAVASELIVNQSTFFGNNSTTVGGAILIFAVEGSSTTSIVNSTFNQNTAARGGAIYKGSAIFGGDPLELNLTSVTIAGNTATDTGGGLFIEEGNVRIINSIVAGNSSNDINGTIISRGYNLIQSTSNTVFTGGMPQSTDIIGVNPMLSPLTNNGGKTDTMALAEGSPAIDKGTSSNVQLPPLAKNQKSKNARQNLAPLITTDQRGEMRPSDFFNIPNTGDGADIGAFELTAPTAANASITGKIVTSDGNTAGAIVTLTDQNGQTRTIHTGSFGNFTFEEIPSGAVYVISVQHKRYRFSSQVISLNEDVRDLIFTPLD
ncbi:MAG TPA: choice-of-anchor Q domain-containing protein [Pyrinomonadaceae bacterium]|nr:choice-of-anchor Q domain-containing protein [Pyrinomonadaceae bacterium]